MGLEPALHDVRVAVVLGVSLQGSGKTGRPVWGASQSAFRCVRPRGGIGGVWLKSRGRVVGSEA
jgi:hypothetical protein